MSGGHNGFAECLLEIFPFMDGVACHHAALVFDAPSSLLGSSPFGRHVKLKGSDFELSEVRRWPSVGVGVDDSSPIWLHWSFCAECLKPRRTAVRSFQTDFYITLEWFGAVVVDLEEVPELSVDSLDVQTSHPDVDRRELALRVVLSSGDLRPIGGAWRRIGIAEEDEGKKEEHESDDEELETSGDATRL